MHLTLRHVLSHTSITSPPSPLVGFLLCCFLTSTTPRRPTFVPVSAEVTQCPLVSLTLSAHAFPLPRHQTRPFPSLNPPSLPSSTFLDSISGVYTPTHTFTVAHLSLPSRSLISMSNKYRSFYENDGSGRDTFVNYAGAYWMNPLPAGTFFKSHLTVASGTAGAAASAAPTENGTSLVMDESTPYPGRTLFGKSRYGTTVLDASQAAALGATGSAAGGHGGLQSGQSANLDGTAGSSAGAGSAGGLGATSGGVGADGQGFDGEATALEHIAPGVPRPEQRLRQPGHASTGLEGTDGGSTFNGVKEPWTAPNAVDSTLLRLAPGYESTCHYHLRTGRFYTEDSAPPHEMTLPDKGVTWGKSRYY